MSLGNISPTNMVNGNGCITNGDGGGGSDADKKWFTEKAILNCDELRISTKIQNLVHEHRSQYQNIMVFDNKIFGRCLVLDDAMQCTELDESAYQEMITFLPLNIHRLPRRVLIIGGGDGGVARECDKHPLVKEIVQCEIDRDVVDVSQRFMPSLGCGFDSSKLQLNFQDGYQYVKQNQDQFDVIITDSCDPDGPAETLFQDDYFRALYDALRPGGIICSQAESYWFELAFIRQLYQKVRKIFPAVAYASTSVPSYPSGQIGFLLAAKDPATDFRHPRHRFTESDCDRMKLRYYSAEMHEASFILPRFVRTQFRAMDHQNCF